MKIDDLINNKFFNSTIYRNDDDLKLSHIKDFIEHIKETTNEECYNNIYVQGLFCIKNGKFVCKDDTICDKFKIIMFDGSCILIEYIDYDLKEDIDYYEKIENRIELLFKGISFKLNEVKISYEDIEDMRLDNVSDYNDYEFDAYKLVIHKKSGDNLVLDTSRIHYDIREDMNKFLFNLKESFNDYSKRV